MSEVTDVVSGRLLNEYEAATILCCSIGLMRKWRLYGGGPGYCRLGRLVRYSEADLVAFIQANRVDVA